MERLTDFNPLKQLALPGLGDLDCSGLVLVVGPNSAGKSQLLRDVFHSLSGDARDLVVATSIELDKPDYDSFVSCLEAEGYIRSIRDDNGTQQYRPLTTYLGSGESAIQVNSDQARAWYNSYAPSDARSKRRDDYLRYFGRFLVTALFLDRRLTAMQQVGTIDFETQPPQDDLHALHLSEEARLALYEEVRVAFSKAVWTDQSRGNQICIRVSDSPMLPSAEDRLSYPAMSKFRTLESEGDGMKSYIATVVAMLLGRRPVCIVDEPEMCLHPPQAYSLGRFIGARAGSTDAFTLTATHSSQVLRGAIQSAQTIQIIRMTRQADEFYAHLVPADVLRDAVAKPTLRAESVLDGIFAQSVVVVEGDGDRLVYQTVWETLSEEVDLDVHFAAVGGVGGIADTCKLYRTLRIPVAVLADMDLITEVNRLRQILDALAPDCDVEALVKLAKAIVDAIKQDPPSLSPTEAKQVLDEIVQRELDWTEQDDLTLRRDLNRLAARLDRMLRLKRGGIAEFPAGVVEDARELLLRLSAVGLFLVPHGELEEWLSDAGIVESKNNKWAWANAAALHIQDAGAKDGDVWEFMRSVGSYLESSSPTNGST